MKNNEMKTKTEVIKIERAKNLKKLVNLAKKAGYSLFM